MSLPASLLAHVEQHACFTGCYGSDSNVQACLDPNQPLRPVVIVSCLDCLGKVGVPLSLLPAGMNTYNLSQRLSDHLRQKRGFRLAKSGYHTAGPGFWLSVAYYDCGVFLVSAERSRQLGSDLDVLMLGIQHNVVLPPDPRMRDPKQYRVETVYVNFSTYQPGVASKQHLLASPQVRMHAQPGWQKVTLAEFLPLSQAAATPVSGSTGGANRPAAAPRQLKVGDTCPVCGAEYRVRPLLNGSFVGCLC
jgi:hypothetical protein